MTNTEQHRTHEAIPEGTLKPTGPLRTLSSQERKRTSINLKKKYDNGSSIRALAAETGWSYGAVHKLLSGVGTTFRGRGAAPRTPRPDQQN